MKWLSNLWPWGSKGPRKIWRRGDKDNYNSMELFERESGSRYWEVHRCYSVKCARCLERNTRLWMWTVPFVENSDPLASLDKKQVLSFRCSRCKDPLQLRPDFGSSEWFYSPYAK